MSAHAFLAPSSAGVWGPGGCPASPRMQAAYPEDQESPESREGTAAHIAVTEPLSGRPVTVGMVAPNGHPIDQEMIDAGQDFVRDVTDTVSAASPGAILRIEGRVNMKAAVHKENWGTPDAYLFDPVKRTIHVWDYKYGHRYVDPFMNWQTIDYAIGVLEYHGVDMSEWPLWTITTTIAQPRNYHPSGQMREWFFGGAQLLTYRAQLQEAAALAMEPDAPMKTGSYCLDCTACAACPAAQQNALRFVDLSLRAQPVDLPPAALGLMLRILTDGEKRIKAMRVSLEEAGLALVRSGVDVPHWQADYSYGREKWMVPVDHVFALGDNFGINIRKEPAAITPAQARKAGLDADMVSAFSEKPRGSLALIPFDNSDIVKRFG